MVKFLPDKTSSTPVWEPVRLGLLVEPSPALFNGPPLISPGALISGKLQLLACIDNLMLESIVLFLECVVTNRRPFRQHCHCCARRADILQNWDFLDHPKVFSVDEGVHELQFSYLIPGHLPATTHGQTGEINYVLRARARLHSGKDVEVLHTFPVRRVSQDGSRKDNVRFFAPSNAILRVSLPSLVQSAETFCIRWRLDMPLSQDETIQRRWHLRKITWHIAEYESKLLPCARHTVSTHSYISHNRSRRDVGNGEIHEFPDLQIGDDGFQGEIEASCNSELRPQCDVVSTAGLEITHLLFMDIEIAEKRALNKRLFLSSPIRAALNLRARFDLIVSARSGPSVTQEQEALPPYVDVEPAPVHYDQACR